MSLIVTPGQLNRRAELYHQLGQLVSAGISLTRALHLIERNPPSRSFRKPLRKANTLINEGATFTDALRNSGTWFNEFDLNLIHACEQSGRLDSCFELLANYYRGRAAIARRLMADMAYPVLLIHAAVFILPFAAFFTSGDLVGYLMRTFGILIPLYLLTAVIIFVMQGRHGEPWRATVESVLRPIPILGSGRHSLALSRLSAALEALLNAGVNLVEGWELAAAASGSPALRRAVRAWRPKLLSGQTPAELVNCTPQFPEVFANLYSTGEVSGKLDDSLRGLHRYYQDDGTMKIHLVAQWTPRIIYGIIAGIVAWKIVSFWSGYFQNIQNIGGF